MKTLHQPYPFYEDKKSILLRLGIISASIIFVLTGNAALRYKTQGVNLTFDKIVSAIMLITGAGMIAYPYFAYGKINIVLTVFGSIGMVMALFDLNRFRRPENLRKVWLPLHIAKMVGGYIAAFTAFIVVTQAIPGILGWLLPTVPGIGVIVFFDAKSKD